MTGFLCEASALAQRSPCLERTRLASTPCLLLNTSASDVAFFSSQHATLPLLRPKGSQQHGIHGRVLQGRENVEEVLLGQVWVKVEL